jgi:formate dehydrogenase subunit gamma
MHTSAPRDGAPPSAATPAQLAAVDAALARLRDLPGALLPIFHAIQDELGFVPQDGLDRIADALNLSRAEVFGTLTFYHDFRTAPPGACIVKLCRAEACQATGCRPLEAHLAERHGLPMGATTSDGAVTLEPVYCLGNCALGPSALVDGKLHARLTAETLDAILAAARQRCAGGHA